MEHELKEGTIVVISAFDDTPEHLFCISEVYEDCVGGYSITGPLKDEYGEPEFALILRVHKG